MTKKVLIVDDSAFMRRSLKDVLEKAGYETCGEAETSEEALRQYARLHPDLVTMDMVLVGDQGIQAVKGILAQDCAANVLVVSAMGQQASVVECIRAGAKGFVVKPFKPQELLAEVERILR